MSLDDLETAYSAAEDALRAYYEQTTAKYEAALPEPDDWQGPEPHQPTVATREAAWTQREKETLERLRDNAAKAAVALLAARDSPER